MLARTLTPYQVYSGLSDLYSLFEEHDITPLFHAAIGSDSSSEFTPQSMHFMWLDRARKVLQSIAFCTTKKALEMGPPRCKPLVPAPISLGNHIVRHAD